MFGGNFSMNPLDQFSQANFTMPAGHWTMGGQGGDP